MRTLYISLMVFVLFFAGTPQLFAFDYTGTLRVTDIDDDQVSLSWDAESDANGYIVYYDYTDTLDPDDPQYFEQSDPVTETFMTIDNLESDADFSFVVAALDTSGNESTNTSNEVSAKTFTKRPDFAIADKDIVTEDNRKIVIPFTSVINLDADHEINIVDLDSPNQSSLLIKGYLPWTTDLRNLEVFLTEPMSNGGQYRVEVVRLQNSRGESIGENNTKVKEFIASFEDEMVAATDDTPLPEPEPEYTEPVEIDSLPVTWPVDFALMIMAVLVLATSYFFFRFRKS